MEDASLRWLHTSEIEAPVRGQMPFLGASFRSPRDLLRYGVVKRRRKVYFSRESLSNLNLSPIFFSGKGKFFSFFATRNMVE